MSWAIPTCPPPCSLPFQPVQIGKHLHAFELPVEGAEEAWAVDGTPADSVMIALYGPLLKNPAFKLVVSGINRGDKCAPLRLPSLSMVKCPALP